MYMEEGRQLFPLSLLACDAACVLEEARDILHSPRLEDVIW